MTAFPTPQRAALTRLRETHPRARITVYHRWRQDRWPCLKLRMQWTERSRVAYVTPTGRVFFAAAKGRGARARVVR